MITTYQTEIGQAVKATELYDYLGLDKSQYSRFIKRELLENPYADEKSYSVLVSSEIRHGRFRQEYYLHIDFAKKLCMVSKSKKGNEIRDELVALTKKVENYELLNEDQILFLVQLKEVFKYVSNCEKAEKMHMAKFVEAAPDKRWAYPDFHKMRNTLLGLGQEELNNRLKAYCVENMATTSAKDKRTKLFLLDRYEILRNGIWDYLMCSENEQSMRLANLAMKMARLEGTPIERQNEKTLYRDYELGAEIKGLVTDNQSSTSPRPLNA
jgi:phage anti-repressor protein